jgi:hypothetical protein
LHWQKIHSPGVRNGNSSVSAGQLTDRKQNSRKATAYGKVNHRAAEDTETSKVRVIVGRRWKGRALVVSALFDP